jgi:ubiquitin carboxyl-terminal hydrolase 9/24
MVAMVTRISRWNLYNGPEPSLTYVQGVDVSTLFARPIDSMKHNMKGRLVDLINIFGQCGGFEKLKKRICEREFTVPILAAILKPFGHCYGFITPGVYEECIVPVVDKSIEFLNSLNDDILKKEAATDSRSETLSSIMKSLRHLCKRIPGREDIETYRLKMILRLLQISSFSGKMHALNEINKIIQSPTYHPHFRSANDEDHVGVDRIAEWIKNNSVLEIVFKDNLHQPQVYKHFITQSIHSLIMTRTSKYLP